MTLGPPVLYGWCIGASNMGRRGYDTLGIPDNLAVQGSSRDAPPDVLGSDIADVVDGLRMKTIPTLADGAHVRVRTKHRTSTLNGLEGCVIDIRKAWGSNPSILVLFETTPFGRKLWFMRDELEAL